jgi:hypothetical protein
MLAVRFAISGQGRAAGDQGLDQLHRRQRFDVGKVPDLLTA